MTHFVVHPWRERLRTGLLVIAVAVPVGIVIGGGLDLGGPDEGVVRAGDPDAAAADTSTSSTTASTTPSTTAATSTTVAPTTTADPVPSRTPKDVRVRFYNGSRTAGAAVTVGDRLRPLGYALLPPGPSPADPVPATVIAFRAGNEAEAAAVARALGTDVAPTPMPPTPNVTGIGNADVVVIVGDELVPPA